MPLKFYLDQRKNKHGEAPVRVVWSFNGDRYQTTMGFSIPPESWDKSACRVTPAAYNHKKTASTVMNSFIASMEKAVNNMENYCLSHNSSLTKPLVKQIVADVLANGGEFPYESEKGWKRILYERRQIKTRCFEHFRGGKYKLIGFGKDTETLENVVIYQALYGANDIWVRPYDMFFGKVKDEDGNEIERFKELP